MPPTEQAFETYTPCYDWVIQATGCQATALTYGVVWRYAQMSGARCYASCERLAGHLAWSRKSVLRHLQRLLRLGLIVCANPGVPGVTREYLPVSRERWMAAHGTAGPLAPSRAAAPPETDGAGENTAAPDEATGVVSSGAGAIVAVPIPSHDLAAEPVPTADTPCDNLDQGPVPNGDTRNTIRNTSKIQVGTAGRRDPRIVLLRKLTGRVPPAILRAQVLAALGPSPAPERLTECYRAWCARGYNPMNYAWLFDWYDNERIPPAHDGRLGARAPVLAAPETTAAVVTASGATASVATFARWQSYQQAIQKGENPDEVRRRLNL